MANTYVAYPCDGTVDVFAVTFPYLEREHVKVFVDAAEDTGYTWETDSTVRLSSMPIDGEVVTVKRVTPSAARSADFVDSALLDEETLDASMNELFYIMQEAVENVEDSMAFNRVSNSWEGAGFRLSNLENPVNAQDAVTKNHFDAAYVPQITADKAIVAADKAIVTADKAIVAADKAIVAADKATVASNTATAGASKDAAVAAKVASEAARDISLTVQDTVIAEGDAQETRVVAEGDTQDARVVTEGDTQVARVVAEGDTQDARVVTEGDTQDARVISQGDIQENRVSSLVPGKNLLINGGFDIWQRGASQTLSGYYSDDRWANLNAGSTKEHSKELFPLGQTDVPGNPQAFSRTVVTSVTGTANQVTKYQRIERVATLAGETATLSFWAKADASKNLSVDFYQYFGTGGSPSAPVQPIGATKVALTTSWQKFTHTFAIPSIAGKVLGTSGDALTLRFWFDAGTSFDANSSAIGHQSGTFDIAQVQLEKGTVATQFEYRTEQEELELCQRYYQHLTSASLYSGEVTNTVSYYAVTAFLKQMRIVPAVTASNQVSNAFPTSVGTLAIANHGIREVRVATATVATGIFQSSYKLDAEL